MYNNLGAELPGPLLVRSCADNAYVFGAYWRAASEDLLGKGGETQKIGRF